MLPSIAPDRRPVEGSCLSEGQIDTLYKLASQFQGAAVQRPADFASALDQVRALTGGVPEVDWVMGQPTDERLTPFLRQVRADGTLMAQLQMSFKPTLRHSDQLSSTDMIKVLARMGYWLKDDRMRSLSVVGVTDEVKNTMNTDTLLGNLTSQWSGSRYHVALLSESRVWRSVLIDRRKKSFEYYDPTGWIPNMQNPQTVLARQVTALYKEARKLDKKIVIRGRKARKKRTSRKDCGFYVLYYLHQRVVEGQTLASFQKARLKTCDAVRAMFFQMPQTGAAPTGDRKMVYRVRFGKFDVRLATLELVKYVDYVSTVIDEPSDRPKLANLKSRLFQLATSDVDYVQLLVAGAEVQKLVFGMLPAEFREYAGADTWFAMVREVGQDPLVRWLRAPGDANSRSSKVQRRVSALHIYKSLTGWTQMPQVQDSWAASLATFMRSILDRYYLPLLEGPSPKQFPAAMEPVAFLEETMRRQETVAFGTHFLRAIRRFLLADLKLNPSQVRSELDDDRFARRTNVVKPLTGRNFQQIKSSITKCDLAIREAHMILQQSFQAQMVRPAPAGMAVPRIQVPSQQPVSRPSASRMSASRLEQMTLLNQSDLENRTFLVSGRAQPWNFPVDVRQLATHADLGNLPETFQLYSVDPDQMRKLINDFQFRLYFTVGVWLAFYRIHQGTLTNRTTLTLLLMSLIQFYNVSSDGSEIKRLLCLLLSRFYTVLHQPQVRLANIQQMRDFLSRFHQICSPEHQLSESAPFFARVMQTYRQLVH